MASDLMTPIAGVSLEKYAELVVRMRGVMRDRNASGAMVPFSSFATGHWVYGPTRLERYKLPRPQKRS